MFNGARLASAKSRMFEPSSTYRGRWTDVQAERQIVAHRFTDAPDW
jgi:hypothetical protein